MKPVTTAEVKAIKEYRKNGLKIREIVELVGRDRELVKRYSSDRMMEKRREYERKRYQKTRNDPEKMAKRRERDALRRV